MELKDKIVVITGAGSGIGRASARLFASQGAKVLAVDLNEEGLQQTIEGADGTIEALTANVADESSVQGYVDSCISQFGGLDIVYANAGISGGAVPIFDQPVELWEDVLRVNLIGPFLAVKYAGKCMVEQGSGSIVCTASVAGLRANAGGSPYSASKAGVISLVQTVSNQLFGTGVRINAICPGLIETGMTKPTFDLAREKGKEEKIGQINPTKRFGEPSEIGEMACFLLSDRASYVNGQAVPVDGGLSASHPWVFPRN